VRDIKREIVYSMPVTRGRFARRVRRDVLSMCANANTRACMCNDEKSFHSVPVLLYREYLGGP